MIPSGQNIQQRKHDFFPVLEGMHFEQSISGRDDLQSPVFPASASHSLPLATVNGSS